MSPNLSTSALLSQTLNNLRCLWIQLPVLWMFLREVAFLQAVMEQVLSLSCSTVGPDPELREPSCPACKHMTSVSCVTTDVLCAVKYIKSQAQKWQALIAAAGQAPSWWGPYCVQGFLPLLVIFISTFICFCHLVLAAIIMEVGTAPSLRGKGSSKPRSALMRLSESTSLFLIGYYSSNRSFPERSSPGRHSSFFSLLWFSIMLAWLCY